MLFSIPIIHLQYERVIVATGKSHRRNTTQEAVNQDQKVSTQYSASVDKILSSKEIARSTRNEVFVER